MSKYVYLLCEQNIITVLIGSYGGHLGFSKFVFAILIPLFILKGSTMINIYNIILIIACYMVVIIKILNFPIFGKIFEGVLLQPQISHLRSTSVFVSFWIPE